MLLNQVEFCHLNVHLFLSASTFSRIRVSHTNLEEDPEGIKEVLKQFLGNIVSNLADRRDQEELSIVNNRQSTAAY